MAHSGGGARRALEYRGDGQANPLGRAAARAMSTNKYEANCPFVAAEGRLQVPVTLRGSIVRPLVSRRVTRERTPRARREASLEPSGVVRIAQRLSASSASPAHPWHLLNEPATRALAVAVMPTDGYNWFLILVACVCAVVVVAINVYILVHFQHPEDRNQAWWPKIVVVRARSTSIHPPSGARGATAGRKRKTSARNPSPDPHRLPRVHLLQVFGLTLAELSILLLPLDVANRAACSDSIVLSACNFALPMLDLWYAVYMTMFVMMALVIPFTIFYYEQDHDTGVYGKVISSASWGFGTFTVIALILGLCYGFVGYVDLPVSTLVSGLAPLDAASLSVAHRCVAPEASGASQGYACDASGDSISETWSVRTTFPVYVIALTSVVSWVLFMVFAGVGVSAIPVDEIKAFLARPKKVIAKSEYIRIAGKIAEETKSVLEEAREVQREERSAGRTRKTRRALAKIEKRLASLEDDELTLQRMFPQGEDRDVRWTLTVMGYYGHLAAGGVSAIVSTAWIVHVCVYVFPDQPLGTFLNGFFVALDSVWGLFGTVAFALFCFYLILCVVKGCVKVGFPLLIFTVYPMKLGGTLMSSFLFNVELIMLSSVAVIQFCTRAFDGYAAETSVSDIFGGEIENLRGLGILFKEQVFLYCFFACAGLAAIALVATEARESRKPRRAFESI